MTALSAHATHMHDFFIINLLARSRYSSAQEHEAKVFGLLQTWITPPFWESKPPMKKVVIFPLARMFPICISVCIYPYIYRYPYICADIPRHIRVFICVYVCVTQCVAMRSTVSNAVRSNAQRVLAKRKSCNIRNAVRSNAQHCNRAATFLRSA